MTMTASIEGLNMKMELPPSDGTGRVDIIFHGDQQELVMVDHGARKYTVLDQATIKQVSGQMSAALAQVQEQLKNLPPEQRAMMEKMMKGRGMMMPAAAPAPTELRRTSEGAKQSGYDAVKYEVLREGTVIRTMWLADWTAVTGAGEARTVFERMAGFMKEMTAGLPQFLGNMGQDAFEHMKDLGGFPVRTTEYDESGRPSTDARLVSAESQTIPAGTFEPPSGFSKQAIGR